MFAVELATRDDGVRLIRPDVIRDSPLSVRWLAGQAGRATLHAMGLPDAENHESTLAEEQARVTDFLVNTTQLYWMIALRGAVVGAVWVDLQPSEHVAAPAINIMIGDPQARGRGVGTDTLQAVVDWLESDRHEPTVYARHLLENRASASLLEGLRFRDAGAPYTDTDGLQWQNMVRTAETPMMP